MAITSGSQAVGISLWLVFDADTCCRLAGLIDALAVRYGMSRFDPHVMLLGGSTVFEVAVLDAARDVAAVLPRLAIRFIGVADSEEFFRCVVLDVAEDSALMGVGVRVWVRFVTADRSPYRLYLSLVYSN